MKARRVLPYLAALVLLSWILGSLARSGSEGTSIISNSYWLVYLVYLIPFLAVGTMIVLAIYLAMNWKLVSDALGFGIAQRKRKARKQSSTVRLMVWMGFWGIAIGVLLWKCGGIFCRSENQTQTLPESTEAAVEASPSFGFLITALQGPAYALASFVTTEWFVVAFLGLLIVSSVILARSIKVSMDETRAGELLPDSVREEGTVAVRDALKVLEMGEVADHRTRIIRCYERVIRAAAGLGADVSVDKTARELEAGIRGMFQLKGRGIRELTRLFEEARYSLHEMGEDDSLQAQSCLLEIGKELDTAVPVEN